MRTASVIAAASLLWLTQSAAALTGREALAVCQMPTEGLWCTFLVTGYFEMSGAMVLRGGPVPHCNPEITVGIAKEVFIAYLRNRPDLLDKGAAALYLDSVERAFPCKR